MHYNQAIFFESSPTPMWIFNLHTLQIVDVNAAAFELYGYTKKEFLSLKFTDLFHKEDIPKFHNHFDQVVHGIENTGFWRHRTKYGQILIVDITAETYEENGEFYRIIALKDITNKISIRKLHELSLKQLKYHLKNTPFLYIEWDNQIRVKNFSTEILTKYGFSFDEFYKKNPNDLIHLAVGEKDIEQINYRMKEILTTDHKKSKFNFRFYNNKGEIIYTEWHNSILRDENGQVISIMSLIEDVTPRKKVELELKSNNELLEAVIQSMPGIFYMFDLNGNYIKWNENFERLLGHTTEEFAEEHLLDHYLGRDRDIIINQLNAVKEKGEVEFTAHIRDVNGSEPKYFLTGVLCPFHGKEYIVGCGYDISKLEKAENDLKDASHTQEVLLSEVHHRVKNNLAVITGLLELATTNCQNPEARNTLQESMLRIRSMALVHEKLYKSAELSRIHMKDYIRELVDMIHNSIIVDTDVHINTDIDDLPMNLNYAIPTALIINELVSNALKHAFKGRQTGTINIIYKKNNNYCQLEVNDNGIGLQTEFSNATTLGLTIVKTLARQLKASLHLENDDGTRIIIRFPSKRQNVSTAYSRH